MVAPEPEYFQLRSRRPRFVAWVPNPRPGLWRGSRSHAEVCGVGPDPTPRCALAGGCGGGAAPLPPTRSRLVRFACYGCAALADEKIQVCPLVRLQYVVDVEPRVAAVVRSRRGFPCGRPTRELDFGHVEVQAARLHVKFDEVAVLDQG